MNFEMGENIMEDGNPTINRLEDQINWYDQKSQFNQSRYKIYKVAVILVAAIIPFAAGMGASSSLIPYITGGLGVVIILLEGLQSLNQYQTNWTNYRSICEGLKHEKYLWLAKAGSYSSASEPDKLLAERIESLISQEHAKWVMSQESAAKANEKKE